MSLIKKYSDIYGIPFKEVQEWVNNIANKTNLPESILEWIEPTKEERINSIKSYIQSRVDESITERVKGSIVAERIERSELKSDIQSCPF